MTDDDRLGGPRDIHHQEILREAYEHAGTRDCAEDGTPLIGNWSLHMAEEWAREGAGGDMPYNSHLLAALHAIDLLKAVLREIARLAVLSAHAQKYLRNMETIDRIRDIAREALAVDEVSP